MGKILGIKQFLQERKKAMDFSGSFYHLLGRPEPQGAWIIWGQSGSGKTTFTCRLAKYLAEFGRVAYLSLEEGDSLSLQRSFQDAGMMEVNGRVVLLDMNFDEMVEKLAKPKSWDIVIIDSLQYARIDYDTYRDLRSRFPPSSSSSSVRPTARTPRVVWPTASVMTVRARFTWRVSVPWLPAVTLTTDRSRTPSSSGRRRQFFTTDRILIKLNNIQKQYSMATTKRQTKKHSHALFWTLLKETPGYDPCYKEVIKEGITHEHSGGRTTSLNEMYENYPSEYSRMIDAMKPKGEKKLMAYEERRDLSAKRVIAAICQWVDKLGYKFRDDRHKLMYVKGIACRAANCGNFNAIPDDKLTAIYNLYCKRNSVGIEGNPELDHPAGKN